MKNRMEFFTPTGGRPNILGLVPVRFLQLFSLEARAMENLMRVFQVVTAM